MRILRCLDKNQTKVKSNFLYNLKIVLTYPIRHRIILEEGQGLEHIFRLSNTADARRCSLQAALVFPELLNLKKQNKITITKSTRQVSSMISSDRSKIPLFSLENCFI